MLTPQVQNMGSKKHHTIGFNEREEQLFDILNKYNNNLLIKPQLNLEREYALKAAAARQEYSNDFFNFIQGGGEGQRRNGQRNGLIEAYRNQQSKSVGAGLGFQNQQNNGGVGVPNGISYGFQGIVQPESPDIMELKQKMRYTEKYKQMRDQAANLESNREIVLGANNNYQNGQYSLVLRGQTPTSIVNILSEGKSDPIGKDPAETFANRAIDAHVNEMKQGINKPFTGQSRNPALADHISTSMNYEPPKKPVDFNFKLPQAAGSQKPPKYKKKDKYQDGYAFENVPEQNENYTSVDFPRYPPRFQTALPSREKQQLYAEKIASKEHMHHSQATAQDLGIQDLPQLDGVMRTSTEQHPRQHHMQNNFAFERYNASQHPDFSNFWQNMDQETLMAAMSQLVLPPIKGASSNKIQNKQRQSDQYQQYIQSGKWRSPFDHNQQQPGGFVNRLFRNNKKAASTHNLPSKLYLEQFQESLRQISKMVPGGSIFMKKLAATPLLLKTAKLASQTTDAEQMYLSLQDRLLRFADKKITTLRPSDEEDSPNPDDGGDYLGLNNRDEDPTATKVRKITQKGIDMHRGMFQVDPKVREENVRRKKMKALLKELRKPQYRQIVKIHPSLRGQDTDEENIQILEALLRAEEKEYKQPEMVVLAPQTIEQVPKGKQQEKAFPLQNYMQNKKIKDISSTGGPGGISFVDPTNNGGNNVSNMQDSTMFGTAQNQVPSPIPNALKQNTQQQDLKAKLQTTKEELNEVLTQMNLKDTPQAPESKKAPRISHDDEDLSPETRDLMNKVMNKRPSEKTPQQRTSITPSYETGVAVVEKTINNNTQPPQSANNGPETSKQLRKMMSLSKQAIETKKQQAAEKIDDKNILRKGTQQIRQRFMNAEQITEEQVEEIEEQDEDQESEDSVIEEDEDEVEELDNSNKNASGAQARISQITAGQKEPRRQSIVEQFVLKQPPAGGLQRKGTGALNMSVGSSNLRAKAQPSAQPAPVQKAPEPPKPQPGPVQQPKSTNQNSVNVLRKGTQQIRQRFMNSEQIEEEQIEGIAEEDESSDNQDLQDAEENLDDYDDDKKDGSKRNSKRQSTVINYVPPDVQQFKLVQPPAGGLQRKGTGRVDFGIRAPKKQSSPQQQAPPPVKKAPEPPKIEEKKPSAKQEQINVMRKGTQQIRQRFMNSEQIEEEQIEGIAEEDESSDNQDLQDAEEDLDMYDEDKKDAKRPSKRQSSVANYVPPDVEQFKLVQPPAGGLQRKGTGRLDFNLRGQKKKTEEPPKVHPKVVEKPLPPVVEKPKPQSASSMLRKGTQQIRQRFMNSEQIEEEQIEGIMEEDSSQNEEEENEYDQEEEDQEDPYGEEEDGVADIEETKKAYDAAKAMPRQSITTQPRRQSIVEQFVLKQPPAGGLQRKGTGAVNFGLGGSKLGMKGKQTQPQQQQAPPPHIPKPMIQVNLKEREESEEEDDDAEMQMDESPITPLSAQRSDIEEEEKPPAPIIPQQQKPAQINRKPTSAGAFGLQSRGFGGGAKSQSTPNLQAAIHPTTTKPAAHEEPSQPASGMFQRQQTKVGGANGKMVPLISRQATRLASVVQDNDSSNILAPKTFGGGKNVPSPNSSTQHLPQLNTGNNTHIVPDQPQPKMTRKPTSAGAFGVQSRAFGAKKPSPSPSKISDTNSSHSSIQGPPIIEKPAKKINRQPTSQAAFGVKPKNFGGSMVNKAPATVAPPKQAPKIINEDDSEEY